MEIEFHRLENTEDKSYKLNSSSEENKTHQKIICSFTTNRLGIIQICAENEHNMKRTVNNIDMSLSTPKNEPDFNVLTESEQTYIKKHMTAALLLTFYPHELVN